MNEENAPTQDEPWVSPKTQEEMLLEELALSETLVRLCVSHDLLEAE